MLSLRFKQQLAQMLCTQLKTHIASQQLTDYQNLLIPCIEWTNKHYELASDLIGVSTSSIKRVFLPQNYDHTSFNKRTKECFCTFLGYAHWIELELYIMEQALLDSVG